MSSTEPATNLFESAGPKQTAADFTPASDTIETNFGTLEFVGGSFPTAESAKKIYDELDLQRATQAYMDFYPALSETRADEGNHSSEKGAFGAPGWNRSRTLFPRPSVHRCTVE